MSYLRQGINYGIGSLEDTKIEADLEFIRQHFSYIRVTYPNFDSTSIAYWQEICMRARRRGIKVMWGISDKPLTSANINTFVSKYIELAPWAAKYGIVYGVNEEMLHNDASITDAQVHAALSAAVQTAKGSNPNLKTIISVAGTGELDTLISLGKGNFDYVGINQFGFFADHKNNVDKLVTAFGGNTTVSEYNSGRGFDMGVAGAYGTEETKMADIKARLDYVYKSKVGTATNDIAQFYFYTYARNTELGDDGKIKWDIRTTETPRAHHQAFQLFKRDLNTTSNNATPEPSEVIRRDARFVAYDNTSKLLTVEVDRRDAAVGATVDTAQIIYNIDAITAKIANNTNRIAELQTENANYQALIDGFSAYM